MKKLIISILFFLSSILTISYVSAGESQTDREELSSNLELKIDSILSGFFKKTEKKYSEKEQQVSLYEKINDKLYSIRDKVSGQKLAVINYLLEKITFQINGLNQYYYDLTGKKFLAIGNEPFWAVTIDGNNLTFQDIVSDIEENYTITATEFAGEITFDTTGRYFFVFKRERCINDMSGFIHDYSAYVYEGGQEIFGGCANEVIDFENQTFSGFGTEPFWAFDYANNEIHWSQPGEVDVIETDYTVTVRQIGNGVLMESENGDISMNFIKENCVDESKGDTHGFRVEIYKDGIDYEGCADIGE